MGAAALQQDEIIMDLASELAEDPSLSLVQLGYGTQPGGPQHILQIWARDIAQLSAQSFPCIQVRGAPGGMVQLCDPQRECQAAQWQRQLKDSDYPGVTVYSCYEDGKSIQLVVQDDIHVFDAEGNRI